MNGSIAKNKVQWILLVGVTAMVGTGLCLPIPTHGATSVETNAVFQVARDFQVTSVDQLVKAASRKTKSLAVSFQCRKTYPPSVLPSNVIDDLKKRGLPVPELQANSTDWYYYLGVQIGDSFAYIASETPIEQIGTLWNTPITATVLTNGLAFTGLFYDINHTVTGKTFNNKPSEFGIAANEGFSTLRVLSALDLENANVQEDYELRDGILRGSSGEREYRVMRDQSGDIIAISSKRDDAVFSLVSSNRHFTYQLEKNGEIFYQVIFANVFCMAEPERVFGHIWKALFPSPETYVSFHTKATNVTYKAGSIDFSDIQKSVPLGGRSRAQMRGAMSVRSAILIVLLGVTFVVISFAVREIRKNKTHI